MSDNQCDLLLKYDGEVLKSHEMDISELGGALLSIGGLIQSANEAINGNATKVNVRVKAHTQGSFGISLVMEIIEDAEGFLTGDFVTSILNLKDLLFSAVEIGGSGAGLFWLIKKTSGKTPEKITQDHDSVTLNFQNNQTVIVQKNVYKLYNNKAVREYANRVVSPVQKSGIESFEVIDKNGELFSVGKQEVAYFEVPDTVGNLM